MNKKQKYTFISLMLASTVAAYAQYQMNVFSIDLITAYQISASRFAFLFTAPMLPAIFLSIPLGKLSDKIGYRNAIQLGLAFTILGLTGRIFAESYSTLWICMAFSGASSITLFVNSARVLEEVVPAEKSVLFMGIYTTASMLAQTFATATSAVLYSTLQKAYVGALVYAVVITVIWAGNYCIEKENAENTEFRNADRSSEQKGKFSEVLSCKGIWFTAVSLFCILGATITLNTFLPAALMEIHGCSKSQAGTVASMISFGNMFGAVIGPVLYRKLKKFSRLIFLFGGISIIGCIGGWMLHEQILMIIIYFITGIAIGGAMPIYFTMPIRLREISSDNISTAGGLITTFQLGGAVIVPSYIIAPIAGNNYSEIFILTAVVIAIAVGLGVLLEKELVKL